MESSGIPVADLKGIGPKTAAALQRLGIFTADDLIRHYPHRFDFYPAVSGVGSAADEEVQAFYAAPAATLTVVRRGRFVMTSGILLDESGKIRVVWYNMPYLKSSILPGKRRVFCGRVRRKNGALVLEQPRIFSAENYREISSRPVPVYPLTEGIRNSVFVKAVREALGRTPAIRDWLPEEERVTCGLLKEDAAIRAIHAPSDMEEFERARRRIVFDEFFRFLAGVRNLRKAAESVPSPYRMETARAEKACRALFPFRFTGAQERAAAEIAADLSSGRVMNRLIQGDVGSGKTAVAATALCTAFYNGWQSAVMVPTELLARQHFKTLTGLFSGADRVPRILLLTGSMKESEKVTAREKIRRHEADIVVGTHALIQDSVEFSCLSLIVADEQHRFGVFQRAALSAKGNRPHVLVMSATPIPRTLAVILYGDLDISVIDELPSGRIPVKNAVISREDRPRALLHIRREIEKGHQAYIVCPLVEADELTSGENVTDYSAALAQTFRGIASVGCLHGKMKESEKQRVMSDFLENKIDILVSTTVVEVGVDVPNATVMMIENAERFGLASLHQLRGRVGRSAFQSYCIFVQGKKTEQSEKRLNLLAHSNDGFEIAAQDLKMRGPGDLFGAEQSGELTFGLGDIYNDYSVLKLAREVLDRTGGAFLPPDTGKASLVTL